MEQQQAKLLEGYSFEGSPEFAQATKDIVISTDFNRTTESPTGLGTIQMNHRRTNPQQGAKNFQTVWK
jgi:hypothetical protein